MHYLVTTTVIFFYTLALAYLFKGRQWNYRKRGAARLSQRSVGACQEWLRCNGLERLWRHHHERVWLQPGRQNKQKRVDHDSFGPLQAKSRRLKFPVYYFPSENSSTLFWDVSFHLACWYYGGHLWGKFDLILVIIHISLAFNILAIFSLLLYKNILFKKKMPEDKTGI